MPRRRSSQRAPLGRPGGGRGIPRKSRGVYAVITDFSPQLQRSRRTGTELGKPSAAPMPYADAVGGAWPCSHKKVGQAGGAGGGPLHACPRPGGAGPRLRASALGPECMTRCTPDATVPGRFARHLGVRCAAMSYTGLEHSPHETQGPGRRAVHARVHRPAPRGSGRCSHGIHVPARGGLCGAARHGPGCRSGLAALALANRPGLGVPATPSVRMERKGGEGSGRVRPVETCWTASRRRAEPPGRRG